MTGPDEPADAGAAPESEADRMLSRIAERLGCSVNDFFAEGAFSEREALSELLHLWHRAADPSARRRILECARAVSRTPD